MEENNSVLFKPFAIGNREVAGRVVKTATAETRASKNGYVTEALLEFYTPIAESGTPLIITGNLYVTEEGKSTQAMCGVDEKNKIPGLKQWADMIHEYGSLLFGQLNHCGRQVYSKAMGLKSAVSASNVTEKLMGTKPRPLTTSEIDDIIQAFARSAQCCQTAGFDGVQVHAGHGYLINQFLSPYTNRRNDDYGGSFQKRMTLLMRIYNEIRKWVGDDFPIILKIGGKDSLPGRNALTTSELVEIARILQEEGIDGAEITVGHYESGFPMIRGKFGPFFDGLIKEGIGDQIPFVRRMGITWFKHPIAFLCDQLWPHYEGFNLPYAREFKQKLSIPIICVGGFQTKEKSEQAVQNGECDAVSIGRAMICDPYLYKHFKEGISGPKCNFCNGCIARAGRLPVDCYEPDIKKEKDAMFAAMD